MNEREAAKLKRRLLDTYSPVTDGERRTNYVNTSSWWGNAEVLGFIGELLAHPFEDAGVTKVIGPASSGHLLGALTAAYLKVGFVAAVKEPRQPVDGDPWHRATTPPDYRDRHIVFGIRRSALQPTDVVLAIDDIIDTGSQLSAMKRLVDDAGAHWAGASTLVDLVESNAIRRSLGLVSVIHSRELP